MFYFTEKKSYQVVYDSLWLITAVCLMLFVISLDHTYQFLSTFQNIFLVLLSAIIFFGLISFVKTFENFKFYTKLVFTFHLFVMITIGLLHHPGLINDDTYNMMDVLRQNKLSTWSSVGYSLFLSLFYKFDKSYFSQALAQLFMYSACVFTALRIFGVNSLIRAVLLSGCALFPLIHATNLYVTRDNLMALIAAYAVLICLDYKFNRKPINFFFLLKTAVIIFIASTIKQDGLVLIAVFPVLLLLFDDVSKKQKAAITAILCGMAFIWHVSLYGKKFVETSQYYQLTGVIHSLNYIVYTQKDAISSEEKEIIGKVVDYDYISKNFDQHAITAFHLNKHFLPVAESDWVKFLSTYRNLVYRFPDDFLKERFQVLSTSMNIGDVPFIFPDHFDSKNQPAVEIRDQFKMTRLNLFPELTNLHMRFLTHFCNHPEPMWSNFFKIFGSPIFIILSAIAYILRSADLKIYKVFAIAAAFSLARLVPVFLLAPEPQMKYYSFLIYTGFFFLIVATSYSKKAMQDKN